MTVCVRVQQEDFDVGAEVTALREGDGRVGAVAVFVGMVRDVSEETNIVAMTLEHYPGMTEKSLIRIIEEAQRRFAILGATVIHRVGTLRPLDQIVLIAVKSEHRGEAFDACRFIIDYLKTEAPFWKQEVTPDGTRWVNARVSDDAARSRWES
ncbi:MAG: molybdenum cofactor biosynthesis protein MoaE [Burkholderiales bacterium]|jgi:molybdopterin synthase catalytic subunit|nr:molybdenum cofactor biosynthesis protein MoaE [Burkholderiales bacterium]